MSDLTKKYYNKLYSLCGEKPNDELEWYDTADTLILRNGIERIEIEANYGSWCNTKDNHCNEDVLFLDIYESEANGYETACTAITLEQMIQLRDYLTHKIEYIQS